MCATFTKILQTRALLNLELTGSWLYQLFLKNMLLVAHGGSYFEISEVITSRFPLYP